VSRPYDYAGESGLIWNDRDVGIRWPIANPIVSARDSAYPALRQLNRESLPPLGGDSKDSAR
jgi:dTDP-4-dehydrorhamnose 3,5-epimerase